MKLINFFCQTTVTTVCSKIVNYNYYLSIRTLAQFLSTQVEDIAEYKILDMFRQMLEACKHLHDHNILHR